MKKSILGILLVAILAKVFSGVLFPGPALDAFVTKELQAEVKKGFLEISPDWDRFLKEWKDSSNAARKKAAAALIVDYATFPELATVYRVRAQLYAQIAPDASRNAVCDGTVSDKAAAELAEQLSPLVGTVGRAMGRMYVEDKPWKAPVDLNKENPWIEFAVYLNRIGKNDILEGLQEISKGKGVTRQKKCEVLGALFSLAGNRPLDTMGSVNIMDFVRSIESFVAHDKLN